MITENKKREQKEIKKRIMLHHLRFLLSQLLMMQFHVVVVVVVFFLQSSARTIVVLHVRLITSSARAARLFSRIQPSISLINGVVVAFSCPPNNFKLINSTPLSGTERQTL